MNSIDTENIASFEKVSLAEYLRTCMGGRLEPYDTEGARNLREALTSEWENIRLPERATFGSAGYDFYLPHDLCLSQYPMTVYTGIRCVIKPGWVLLLFPRSGLGFKYGVQLVNGTGVIDSDYSNADNEGHIAAKLYAGSYPVSLNAGDRFMQGIFVPYGTADNGNTDGERHGGFGSTGMG